MFEFYKFWKCFNDCCSNGKSYRHQDLPNVWLIEVQVSGRLFWDMAKWVRPWQRPESTIWKSQTSWEESPCCEISLYVEWVVNLNLQISDLRNCWQLLITIGLHRIVSRGHVVREWIRITSLLSKSISVVNRVANSHWILLIMLLLGYGTIKFGLYYQIMTDYLAIWWMCQGYTLQEDHVWWPVGAKLHGKVFPYLGMGFEGNSIGHFGNVSSALHVW